MSKLIVDGEVDRPREFHVESLAKLPEQVPDVAALISRRQGSGVCLSAILDAVGVREGATHVTVESTDGGFSASVPVEAVLHALVVYRLADAPLPPAHGGPFRFLIPDAAKCHTAPIDTCANVKFVGRIRLSAGPGKDTRPESPTSHADLHRDE